MTTQLPLVVDIDGTFLKTDMLFEGFWLAMGKTPLETLRVARAHFGDRARLKQEIVRLADIRVDLLPVNPEIESMVRTAQAAGREVIFASASDIALVQRLAEYHRIGPGWRPLPEDAAAGDAGPDDVAPDDVVPEAPEIAGAPDERGGAAGGSGHLGSDGVVNLKGPRKAEALERRYGAGGFAYAGDHKNDLEVWKRAGEAILVGHHASAARALERSGIAFRRLHKGWSRRSLLKGLRPHQWVKNALLVLPLLAAHSLDPLAWFRVILAIAAFSAAASSIYVVNDLLDLEADRQHPKKRFRPLAAGNARIPDAMLTSFALGVFALGAGLLIGWALFAVVALYMVLSLSYSLTLKRLRWVDIATLAGLYTLRVVAGGLAAQVEASGWLIVFIFPTFLALGCVKRLTELTLARSDGKVPGRGYTPADRGDLLNVAGLGVFFSLLVFLLYTFSATAMALYRDPWLLRLAVIPLAIWQVRMVVLGWQGKQDYDPIVFAMRDRTGLAIIAATVLLLYYAAGEIV